MIARPHVLPNQPQCGLRLLEPVKPSLYPRGPRRVKRTHIANQMKRVQEDLSPWRSLGRPLCGFRIFPSVLPAENITKPMWSRKNAPTPRRRLRSPLPRPFVFHRDRHKETRKPEVNPPRPITASPIRERANGDPDLRRNRNVTSRKPFCLALCGKQQACSSAKHSNRNVRQA